MPQPIFKKKKKRKRWGRVRFLNPHVIPTYPLIPHHTITNISLPLSWPATPLSFSSFLSFSYKHKNTHLHTLLPVHHPTFTIIFYLITVKYDGIAENYFISGSSIGIVHTQGTKLNQEVTQGDYEMLLTRKL